MIPVTGGAGYIASVTAEFLRARGHGHHFSKVQLREVLDR